MGIGDGQKYLIGQFRVLTLMEWADTPAMLQVYSRIFR
jgi:hypothetical protein